MTLQLDNITVIPFLLTHLSQFGSNGSHVKATPYGWRANPTRASLDSARRAAGSWSPPGRKSGLGQGKAKASTPPSNLPEGGFSGGGSLAAPVALPPAGAGFCGPGSAPGGRGDPPTTPQERLSVDAQPGVGAGRRACPPVVAPGQQGAQDTREGAPGSGGQRCVSSSRAAARALRS
jgi:hypothetical protein